MRLAGDRYVFLEYGPMELDLNLRVRVKQVGHASSCRDHWLLLC